MFKSLFCKHEWDMLNWKVKMWVKEGEPLKIKHIHECTKCGKFKKITM